MHMLVLLSGMPAKLRREIGVRSVIALEIIAHALWIALAAAIKIQYPTVSHGVGDQIGVKSAFYPVNDVGHHYLRDPSAQKPTNRPNPITTTPSKTTTLMPITFNTSFSPSPF